MPPRLRKRIMMQYSYPVRRKWRCIMFRTIFSVFVSPSVEYDSSLRVQIPSSITAALNLCSLRNLGSPSQDSSIRRKTVLLRIQLPFSIIALFVNLLRIELTEWLNFKAALFCTTHPLEYVLKTNCGNMC